jgi:hypothetical protein
MVPFRSGGVMAQFIQSSLGLIGELLSERQRKRVQSEQRSSGDVVMVVVSFHPGRPQSGAAAIIAGSQAEAVRPGRAR